MLKPIRRVSRAGTAVGATALLICGLPLVAHAAPVDVLDLQLNGNAQDDSGLGHHGTAGSHVRYVDALGAQAARFDRHSPDEHIYYGLDHLINIPDAADGSLDPGTENFSVEIRFRSKEKFGNIIQKGQSTTVGGQVKFQMPRGKVTCMFKTPQGTATAGSGTTLINDNLFHTVRCDRTPSQVTMYIDGVRKSTTRNYTGKLDNSKAWTIGGKFDCDTANGAGADSCDYFSGDVDFVRMTKG
jgi:hypothetical protein